MNSCSGHPTGIHYSRTDPMPPDPMPRCPEDITVQEYLWSEHLPARRSSREQPAGISTQSAGATENPASPFNSTRPWPLRHQQSRNEHAHQGIGAGKRWCRLKSQLDLARTRYPWVDRWMIRTHGFAMVRLYQHCLRSIYV